MRDDPLECSNLRFDPGHAPKIAQMASLMLDHRMSFAHQATSRMKLTEQGLQFG
jgi:hypothetical protein